MQIDKDAFKRFQQGNMLNGGKKLLDKKDKPVVAFDPTSKVHMEAVKVIFFDKSPQAVFIKSQLPFTFMVEPPYLDVISTIRAKCLEYMVKRHEEHMAELLAQSLKDRRPHLVSSK